MEFRFRAEEAKASSSSSTYFSPSISTSNYFTEQAFRAGYFSNEIRRTDFVITNSDPVREAIRRELEKEQIRQEIIAEEIIRKRVLEAEVRREMVMEQNLGFSFAPTSLHYHQFDNSRLQERFSLSSHREIGDFNSLPFQRHPTAAKLTEAKLMNSNFAGIKRKVAAIGGANELALGGLKKKPHKEWSCALCKVSATSEEGLNAHLQGKKHKAKEVELMRENGAARKNTEGSITLPKNSRKENGEAVVQKTQVTNEQRCNNPLQGKKQGAEEEPRANGAPSKDIGGSFSLPNTSDKPEMSKISSNSKPNHGKKLMKAMQKNSDAGVQKKQITEDFKKRFKFWCEDCQVGCHVATVMADHERGKKHMAKLQAPKQDVGNVKQLVTKNEDPAAPKKQEMEDSKNIFKFWCEDCKVSCPNAIVMADHERGKKHMAKLQEPIQDGGDVKHLVTENEEPAVQKKQKEPAVQKKQKMEDAKKRYKFWCDHCRVGCRNATVMANHEKGKKHMASLQATNQDGGDVLAVAATTTTATTTTTTTATTTTTMTTNTTEDTVGKEAVVEQANEEIVVNVDGGEEPQEKALEMKATVDKEAEAERKLEDGAADRAVSKTIETH